MFADRQNLASMERDIETSFMLNLFDVQELSSFEESMDSYKTYQGSRKLYVNRHEKNYPS